MMQLHARLGEALGDPVVRRWGARPQRERVMPPLDVAETSEVYLIRVDTPGLRKDEIAITVSDAQLRISAEVPAADSAEGSIVRRTERFHGPFERVVPLPRQADPASVEASLADGVLTVKVAKRVPDGGRRIEIG